MSAEGLEAEDGSIVRTFTCTCGNRIHFENDTCLQCGCRLGFDPAQMTLRPVTSRDRLCGNYDEWHVCNWLVGGGEARLCAACALTEMVPDPADGRRVKLWYEVEKAKRRLLFSLHSLRLPVEGRAERADGLAFRILADARLDTAQATASVDDPVMTGHDQGLITINLMEAAPELREQMREAMDEPYRTVLGHFRHESGHYYWRRLVEGSPVHGRFRDRFGDERESYADALGNHYTKGPPVDWQSRHVTPYAASHPLEDFAETWAHYLHMTDTLESAHDAGLGTGARTFASPLPTRASFDRTLDDWQDLATVMNSLNRSMGLPDPYPFSLAATTADKLRFVHDLVADWAAAA
ncbi:MAG: hypothetical protein F4Y86_14515 [Gammaproteobacteria bacterium]|nr:hypothetical protein [Gammaproteobacteria bacterium]